MVILWQLLIHTKWFFPLIIHRGFFSTIFSKLGNEVTVFYSFQLEDKHTTGNVSCFAYFDNNSNTQTEYLIISHYFLGIIISFYKKK